MRSNQNACSEEIHRMARILLRNPACMRCGTDSIHQPIFLPGRIMIKFPKLLLSLMSGILMLSAPGAHADALADIQKRGVLRVAVLQDAAPYGSVTSDLKLQGLDIEVAELVAKKMGVKVEMIPVTSAN